MLTVLSCRGKTGHAMRPSGVDGAILVLIVVGKFSLHDKLLAEELEELAADQTRKRADKGEEHPEAVDLIGVQSEHVAEPRDKERQQQRELRHGDGLVHARIVEGVGPDEVVERTRAIGAEALGPHQRDEGGRARTAD